MKTEERDEIIQYLIQIKEKIKREKNSLMPELKEIMIKIKRLEDEKDEEVKEILDFIDEYKTIMINIPVEKEKEKKEGLFRRLFK